MCRVCIYNIHLRIYDYTSLLYVYYIYAVYVQEHIQSLHTHLINGTNEPHNPPQINTIAAETLKYHTQISPWAPLGYDSVGREYWLLSVQEVRCTTPIIILTLPHLHFSTPYTIH